jgi:hypothetical protein
MMNNYPFLTNFFQVFKLGKITKSLSLLLLFLASMTSFAQTTLNPGDIVIIGVNGSGNPDEIAIVTLVPIKSGTTIYISDYFWQNSTTSWVTSGYTNFDKEGVITWITNSDIPAGKVFNISVRQTTNVAPTVSISGITSGVSAIGWTSTTAGSPIGNNGDNWFIYQGTSPTATPTNWVYGFTNTAVVGTGLAFHGWRTNTTTGENNSTLPSALTNGSTAISLVGLITGSTTSGPHYDNNYYNGIQSGTRAQILSAVTKLNGSAPYPNTATSAPQWTGSETVAGPPVIPATIYDFTPGGASPAVFPAQFCILPSEFSVSGGGAICAGGNTTVNLSGSEIGVSYQLKIDGADVGTPIVGTGSGISFTDLSTAGTYTVVGSSAAASCSTTMTGSATITINTPVIPTFGPIDPICSGSTLVLPTSSVNIPAITGTWSPAVNNTATTTYTFTPDAGQCATTATLEVVVNPSTTTTTPVTACDSYKWPVNGVTYTSSQTVTFVDGCDTQILNLTITPSTTTTTPVTACDSYKWAVNGVTYTSSQTVTFVDGCDTQILNLTITPSTTTTTPVTACDSYKWPANGVTYTSSQTVTFVDGCDTQILNLTITPSTTTTTPVTACDSYKWAVNGVTYTSSQTVTFVDGCDTQILNLTITPSTTTTTPVTACDSYKWAVNGVTYTSSQTVTFVDGCDTQILNLTIIPTPAAPLTITPQNLSAGSTVGDLLPQGSAINWYSSATATLPLANTTLLVDNTIYYVSEINGICESTRVPVTVNLVSLGVNQFDDASFAVYPSPVVEKINIDSKEVGRLSVYSMIGKLMISEEISNKHSEIDMKHLSNGLYLVQFTTKSNTTKTIRIIKQ